MSAWLDHLIMAPIVVPLIAGALTVLIDEHRRGTKFAIALVSTTSLLLVAIALVYLADGHGEQYGWSGSIGVYLAANWPAPFGIALAVDRLSALLLLLNAILALAALVFAAARWNRAGVHFQALFQFLLMGINGAFLTADLFNLFVFFEVMLAASYGLVLHGSGVTRVRAGLQYIVVNLVASSFFLIGVSLLYSVTGTLNMADLARIVPQVPASERMLLEAGAAILGTAFLVKSAMWPLNFWLPSTYTAAAPPVAAIFAMMTKVGVYVLLRLWMMTFADGAGESTGFGGYWLLYGGLATLAFGTIGVLAAQDFSRLAGFSLIVSSGTLLAAVGFGEVKVIAAALFYLLSATLAVSAFFLLGELAGRTRSAGANVLALTLEAFEAQGKLSLHEDEEVGVVIPAAMAFLGLAFVCCALLISGLPPLSGFIAKFLLLSAMLDTSAVAEAIGVAFENDAWLMLALIIISGLAAIISLTRLGVRTFWAPVSRVTPRLRVIEVAPIAGLLAVCIALTIGAGPAMRYMDDAARALYGRDGYVDRVLSNKAVPNPARHTGEAAPAVPAEGARP
ncbi:MAG: monovalent cation/H+ antiporter subunit D [Burkholderiales bacterium]|nr:monovalent cation/H+ antiporter subunit D [Burkholderiales bacterium]